MIRIMAICDRCHRPSMLLDEPVMLEPGKLGYICRKCAAKIEEEKNPDTKKIMLGNILDNIFKNFFKIVVTSSSIVFGLWLLSYFADPVIEMVVVLILGRLGLMKLKKMYYKKKELKKY